MLTSLSEARTRHLVILGLPMVFIVGGLLTFHLGGIKLTLSVLGLLTLGTVLIAWFYRPRWWGSTRVQAISILVFGGLVTATFADTFWLPWVTDLYEGLRGQFPDLPALSLPDSVPYWFRLAALALTALVFILVNRLAARRPVLPPPDLAPDRAFPEKGYETLRDEFCTYMRGQLDLYDSELNWSDSDYSTLEAEVEADRHGVRRPRVERDLVDAIRRDRQTRAFLLLGDPGSGKSVSLRRLCRRLYEEVPDTGIVPVYVNLRDWHGTAEPDDEEIQAFIREYLKRSAGRAGKRFLDTWFDAMLADGRFFFLLDSFDEMPSVLDCDDADQRIKTISHAFDRFFHDLHGCRGVLASRRFRQPRGFRGRRLSIRPFKESQIRAAMRRWLQGQALDPDQLVRTLFRERPELVPALRNPFLADLIAHYLIQHQGTLPPSHFAIYQDYLETRLAEDAADLRAHGLNQDAVMDAATQIAWAMYANPDIGLEVDKREFAALVQMERLDDLTEALRMARIIRIGGIRAQRLSFVHRRFAEFFVVRAMLAADDPLPIGSIPEDSRWRDCLALYCGVAPSERVQPIADFCWGYIEAHADLLDSGDPARSRPLIHCLRFLRDGFLSRADCLAAFKAPLSARVLAWIASENPLAAKTASEALGLLDAPARSEGLRLAFEKGSSWIKESALLACRQFGGLDDAAHNAIRAYIRTMPITQFLDTYRDLDFGLSLTEDMRSQRVALHLDLIFLILFWLLLPSLFAMSYRTPITGLQIFILALPAGILFHWLDRDEIHAAIPTEGSRHANSFDALMRNFRARWDGTLRYALFFYLASTLLAPRLLDVIRMPFWLTDSCEAPALSIRFACTSDQGSIAIVSMNWAIPALLLIVPWDFWRDIWRETARIASGLHRSSELMILFRKGSRFLAAFLLTSMLFMLTIYASIALLTRFLGVEIMFAIIALLLSPVFLFLLYCLISELIASLRDESALRSLKWPTSISRSWTYEFCGKLRTDDNRLRFIEAIRLRGLAPNDQFEGVPDAPWLNKRVRESFARIEASWAGLEE